MKTLLFGAKDPRNTRPGWLKRRSFVGLTPPDADANGAYDTADGTALLTPEWDKGNDDPEVIRSSLGLDVSKRQPPSE